MRSRLNLAAATVSPSLSSKLNSMFTSDADVFRMRQVLSDLSNSVLAGRDSILRFSVRAYIDAFPRLMANGGRFNLPDDRDFYSDVLLAAALPDDDFPAFTTATSILLMDLIQNGGGTDNLFWNWDSFASHYRMADPNARAAIMNAFRLGFELGSVRPDAPPSALDCQTLTEDAVLRLLREDGLDGLARVITSKVSAKDAGALWVKQVASPDPRALPAFRFLYERSLSLAPPNPETAPLIP